MPTGGPLPAPVPGAESGVRLPSGFAVQRVLGGQDGPVAVAFDPSSGAAFVAEEGGSGEILRLRTSGAPATVAAGGFPLPIGGIVARDGVVDVAAGGAILQVPQRGGSRKPLAVGMRGPVTGLVATASGRLFVGVTGTGHVATLPWAGGPPMVAAAGLGTPTGLALSGGGAHLYVVADNAGSDEIVRIRPNDAPDNPRQVVATLPAAAAAAGIAVAPPGPFGPAGTLYVAVSGGIDAVDPATGAVRPFLVSAGAGGPRRPAGIAFSPNGRSLLIADVGATFASVPLPLTGAVWEVSASRAAAVPAIQVSPAPGPQNKARPLPPPSAWYRHPDALLGGAAVLVVLAAVLLAQFRRRRV